MFLSQSLFAPRLSYTVNGGDSFSDHMLYAKSVSRPHKGLLFFCFVVPKWCQLYKIMRLQVASVYSPDWRNAHFMRVCEVFL